MFRGDQALLQAKFPRPCQAGFDVEPAENNERAVSGEDPEDNHSLKKENGDTEKIAVFSSQMEQRNTEMGGTDKAPRPGRAEWRM